MFNRAAFNQQPFNRVLGLTASVTLSGSSLVTVAASVVAFGTAELSATSSAAVTPTPHRNAASSVTCTSTVVVVGLRAPCASATIISTSEFWTSGERLAGGQASLFSESAVSASGFYLAGGKTAIDGQSEVVAYGNRVASGRLSVHGSAALSVDGVRLCFASSTLRGVSTLATNALVVRDTTVYSHIEIHNPDGSLAAILSPATDGITDCEITEELNGPCEISFRLPLNCPKVSEIIPERRIVAGGKEFIVLAPATEERTRDGRKVWLKVTAPESWMLLSKQYPTIANDHEPDPPWGTVSILASDLGRGGFPAGSAGSALYRLLQGSGWSVGTVDTTGSLVELHDLETERLNRLENIQKVQETWSGYLLWDSLNKTVSLRDEEAWQPGTGVEIRYRKNLKGVEREVDSDLVTRLYPFGQDDLTIASVNDGQLYIEDHHYTDAVYEGIYENQEIADPEQLLREARKALKELSEPRVSYKVRLADLSVLPEYAHERFDLGDIVRIIDPEMKIDTRARVVKRTYNVFQPWNVTVEIGQPAESLAAMLAESRKASEFVKRVLRPNPGTSNLLKGVINTFATTINSANGKLVWDDTTFQAIEVDENGKETGKRIRITPGGIGISTDGGQTYTTAMTGQGILANAIIVSDLYALASDDGYTQLKGDGLHVFDPNQQERVQVGRWLVDGLEHYGLRVFSDKGTVMLDDQGILQTWEVSKWGNIDATHPLRVRFYLPYEVLNIKHILLRLYLDRFRAHSKAAASGGDTTSGPSSRTTTASGGGTTSGPSSRSTTASGGGTTSGPSSRETTSSGGAVYDTTDWQDEDFGDMTLSFIAYDRNTASHNHGIPDGIWLLADDDEMVYYHEFDGDTHDHGTYAHRHRIEIDSHKHDMDHTHEIDSHRHNMDHTHEIDDHTHGMNHTHEIYPHSHDLIFGIYEDTKASGVTVKINGVDVTTQLGGPFSTDQDMLDIAPYVSVGQVNVVELGGTGLGLIDASIFIQVLLGV